MLPGEEALIQAESETASEAIVAGGLVGAFLLVLALGLFLRRRLARKKVRKKAAAAALAASARVVRHSEEWVHRAQKQAPVVSAGSAA